MQMGCRLVGCKPARLGGAGCGAIKPYIITSYRPPSLQSQAAIAGGSQWHPQGLLRVGRQHVRRQPQGAMSGNASADMDPSAFMGDQPDQPSSPEQQGVWKSFWTVTGIVAMLGSVGGALAALLGYFSASYALALPLVLPVVSLIASLQREGLISEVARQQYDSLSSKLRRDTLGMLTEVRQGVQDVKVALTLQSNNAAKLSSLEARLSSLEGALLNAGRSLREAGGLVSGLPDKLAQQQRAQLEALIAAVRADLQRASETRSNEEAAYLSSISSRLAASVRGEVDRAIEPMRDAASVLSAAASSAAAAATQAAAAQAAAAAAGPASTSGVGDASVGGAPPQFAAAEMAPLALEQLRWVLREELAQQAASQPPPVVMQPTPPPPPQAAAAQQLAQEAVEQLRWVVREELAQQAASQPPPQPVVMQAPPAPPVVSAPGPQELSPEAVEQLRWLLRDEVQAALQMLMQAAQPQEQAAAPAQVGEDASPGAASIQLPSSMQLDAGQWASLGRRLTALESRVEELSPLPATTTSIAKKLEELQTSVDDTARTSAAAAEAAAAAAAAATASQNEQQQQQKQQQQKQQQQQEQQSDGLNRSRVEELQSEVQAQRALVQQLLDQVGQLQASLQTLTQTLNDRAASTRAASPPTVSTPAASAPSLDPQPPTGPPAFKFSEGMLSWDDGEGQGEAVVGAAGASPAPQSLRAIPEGVLSRDGSPSPEPSPPPPGRPIPEGLLSRTGSPSPDPRPPASPPGRPIPEGMLSREEDSPQPGSIGSPPPAGNAIPEGMLSREDSPAARAEDAGMADPGYAFAEGMLSREGSPAVVSDPAAYPGSRGEQEGGTAWGGSTPSSGTYPSQQQQQQQGSGAGPGMARVQGPGEQYSLGTPEQGPGGQQGSGMGVVGDVHGLVAEGLRLLRAGREEAQKAEDWALAERLLQDSVRTLSAALQIAPQDTRALGNYGNALLAQGELKQQYLEALRAGPAPSTEQEVAVQRSAEAAVLSEAQSLLTRAGEQFKAVLEVDGWSSRALINWGRALCIRAELLTSSSSSGSGAGAGAGEQGAGEGGGGVVARLYRAALDKFDAVLEEEPGMVAARYRAALASAALAQCYAPGSRQSLSLLVDAQRYLDDLLAEGARGSSEAAALTASCTAALQQCRAELARGSSLRG